MAGPLEEEEEASALPVGAAVPVGGAVEEEAVDWPAESASMAASTHTAQHREARFISRCVR